MIYFVTKSVTKWRLHNKQPNLCCFCTWWYLRAKFPLNTTQCSLHAIFCSKKTFFQLFFFVRLWMWIFFLWFAWMGIWQNTLYYLLSFLLLFIYLPITVFFCFFFFRVCVRVCDFIHMLKVKNPTFKKTIFKNGVKL